MQVHEQVKKTQDHVRSLLSKDSTGHDWFHVERVWKMAAHLAQTVNADSRTVELAALLHDIDDYKLNGGDTEAGPKAAAAWLISIGAGNQVAEAVADIIRKMSFKAALLADEKLSLEGQCVQDADRLDAIGAIGIARAFAFGGAFGQAMYDPEKHPTPHDTFEGYKRKDGTTVNHFYEKLLLLKGRMNTPAARAIAEVRHARMLKFLDDFVSEASGTAAEIRV